MKLLTKFCSFLLCLVLVSGCGGSRTKLIPFRAKKQFIGYVSGIILDEEEKPFLRVQIKLTSKNYHRTVQADKTSEFVFSHLPTGIYTLEVGPPPEIALNQSGFAKFKIIQYQSISHKVDLRKGKHKKRFTIKLKKGKNIQGVIYEPDGQKPAANQEIYLQNSHNREELFSTVTNSKGNFKFSGLKDQNYRIGYKIAHLMGEDILYDNEINPAMLPPEEIFTLQKIYFSAFAGRVKNQRDKLVANLKMIFFKQGNTGPASGYNFRTDAKGNFQVDRILPGAYDLYLFSNSAAPQKRTITLEARENISGMEFKLNEGGYIRGHLMNKLTKAPLSELMLVLYGHDIFNRLYTETIFSQKHGEFEFNYLLDGKYTIVIIDPKTMLELETIVFQLKDYQKVDDYVIELSRRKGKVKIFKHRQGG